MTWLLKDLKTLGQTAQGHDKDRLTITKLGKHFQLMKKPKFLLAHVMREKSLMVHNIVGMRTLKIHLLVAHRSPNLILSPLTGTRFGSIKGSVWFCGSGLSQKISWLQEVQTWRLYNESSRCKGCCLSDYVLLCFLFRVPAGDGGGDTGEGVCPAAL